MHDDRQMEPALWRYGIISPLLHRDANDLQLCEMLTVVSESRYIHPYDGRWLTISAEAIRKWLYRFNHGGLDALCNKQRSDKGSRHLKIVCANLSMQQPHTPARRPQGRAKVERFFRTVREQFLAKCKYKTFDAINTAFIQYLNDYHHRIHSTLECSPMQKRRSVASVCKHVPEVADIQSLFRLKRRCRVYNDPQRCKSRRASETRRQG